MRKIREQNPKINEIEKIRAQTKRKKLELLKQLPFYQHDEEKKKRQFYVQLNIII